MAHSQDKCSKLTYPEIHRSTS
ncbi:hypothetical protein M3J09_006531 [Ascochyta lentis]